MKVAEDKFTEKEISELTEHGALEDQILKLCVDPNRIRIKDKEDRATREKVLNNFVMRILRKMIDNGFLVSFNGCFSTGKEANVYYAILRENQEAAIKIYKVDILDYKNRSRYMEGEFRLRRWNYSKNPRKMIKKWSEKEFRNLSRLHTCGIPCPAPLYLTENVLVMGFLGIDGVPFPKLKDAQMLTDNLGYLFQSCVNLMRRMYHEAKLVHADLSEYFFRKYGLSLPPLKMIFDFITNVNIRQDKFEFYFKQLMKSDKLSNETDDIVFTESFMPRNLSEVLDYEKDVVNCLKGNTDDILYTSVTGMTHLLIDQTNSLSSAEKSENPDSDVDQVEDHHLNSQKLSKEEIREKRKRNKELVKLENREKRKHKIPKHIKKVLSKKHSKKKA
ncbi:hypothetical protein MXB_2167 [Myxobolus squamalis]|nr:hypothetical protein MXB_2167 [Myxobolus squamalis]